MGARTQLKKQQLIPEQKKAAEAARFLQQLQQQHQHSLSYSDNKDLTPSVCVLGFLSPLSLPLSLFLCRLCYLREMWAFASNASAPPFHPYPALMLIPLSLLVVLWRQRLLLCVWRSLCSHTSSGRRRRRSSPTTTQIPFSSCCTLALLALMLLLHSECGCCLLLLWFRCLFWPHFLVVVVVLVMAVLGLVCLLLHRRSGPASASSFCSGSAAASRPFLSLLSIDVAHLGEELEKSEWTAWEGAR